MSFLISVEVFDADRAGKDKSLGKVDIPAADLAASAQGRWFPLKGTLQATTHRLNVELDVQSLFGPLLRTALLISWDPATPTYAHIRGRYWSAKIDDISL